MKFVGKLSAQKLASLRDGEVTKPVSVVGDSI